MPQLATQLEKEGFHRILVLGRAKVGKTTTCINSLVACYGLGYVIACGDKSSLEPAARRTKKFEFDIVRSDEDFEAVLKEAREGVKASKYAWLLVDDFTLYAGWLEGILRRQSVRGQLDRNPGAQNVEPDGRRVYPEYRTRLGNTVGRLFDLKCHIVFTGHYIESGQLLDGQRDKTGEGVMPLLTGAAREEIPARFKDVIFMVRNKKTGDREFLISPAGVFEYAYGARSADGENKTIPADFEAFNDWIKESNKKTANGGKK